LFDLSLERENILANGRKFANCDVAQENIKESCS
jgi:hypothetical protein